MSTLRLWLEFHRHLFFYSYLTMGKAVPLQAWRCPEGSRKLRFPDFMTTAQDGGKVVSLTHRPLLLPESVPGTHFCQRLSRPQCHSAIGRILCQWKNPMTPAGIEPATFRFVAQHFNHCATAVPFMIYTIMILIVHLFPPLPPNATTCSNELSWFPSWLWR